MFYMPTALTILALFLTPYGQALESDYAADPFDVMQSNVCVYSKDHNMFADMHTVIRTQGEAGAQGLVDYFDQLLAPENNPNNNIEHLNWIETMYLGYIVFVWMNPDMDQIEAATSGYEMCMGQH